MATHITISNLRGPRGSDNYELWLANGHTGTYEDYQATLKGQKGDQGDPGDTSAAEALAQEAVTAASHAQAQAASAANAATIASGHAGTAAAAASDAAQAALDAASAAGGDYDYFVEAADDLPAGENTSGADLRGYVWRDSNPALNGLYVKKIGESVWVQSTSDLPGRMSTTEIQLAAVADTVERGMANAYELLSAPDITPVLTVGMVSHEPQDTIIGYDSARESVRLKIDPSIPEMEAILGNAGYYEYLGDPGIVPLTVDINFEIVTGVDVEAGEFVGLGSGSGGGAWPPSALIPLAAEDRLQWQGVGLNQVLGVGQSLAVGAQSIPPISTVSTYDHLTWDVGPKASLAGSTGANPGMAATKPLVEDSLAADGGSNRGETPCSFLAREASRTLAEKMSISPADFRIFASTSGHGGYRMDQLEKGTAWWQVTVDHIHQLHVMLPDSQLHACFFMQGENDQNSNPSGYRNRLKKFREDIEEESQAAKGNSAPVHMLSYQTFYGSASGGRCLDQLQVIREEPRWHLATPIYHLPRAPDAIHLTNVGSAWVGAYFGRALAYLVEGFEPPSILCLSATAIGRSIVLRYRVPQPPLVLDAAQLAATADFGFVIRDGSGDAPIESILVRNGLEIHITLGRDLDGLATARYALDHLGAGMPNIPAAAAASGNLRDSTSETIEIDGIPRPLFHVAPHQEIQIIQL